MRKQVSKKDKSNTVCILRRARRIPSWCAFLVVVAGASFLTGCFLFPNTAPLAQFAASPATGRCPLTVQLDATSSRDTDGIIAAYKWDFGDGSSSSGVKTQHQYTIAKTYNISLTVIDDDGTTGTEICTISVLPPNQPPIASVEFFPTFAEVEEVVYFDASSSYDSDGSIVACTWDFGDGTKDSGVIVEHQFTAARSYTVTLTVADDEGATASTSVSVTVISPNQAPVALFEFSPTCASVQEDVHFDASASYDRDGMVIFHRWSFGDGETGVGETITHRYVTVGSHPVQLTVEDDSGSISTYTRLVQVGSIEADSSCYNLHYGWRYESVSYNCEVTIPKTLYVEYQQRPRGPWTYRNYDEYILDPLDDGLMANLVQTIAALSGTDYYSTIESALCFV